MPPGIWGCRPLTPQVTLRYGEVVSIYLRKPCVSFGHFGAELIQCIEVVAGVTPFEYLSTEAKTVFRFFFKAEIARKVEAFEVYECIMNKWATAYGRERERKK